MRRAIFIVLCFILLLPQRSFAEEVLKLATTTSTYETGLLDYILPVFEEKYAVKVHIISVGTGKAIKLGESGDVDIILVHAPEAESRFVSQGFGVNRRNVMYNDFVILGPKDDPARIKGTEDLKEALERIYNTNSTFVSRGDDSGTDKKEKSLWVMAGLRPKGRWYLETGQGMNATLRIADEKGAYCLVDRGTYLFNKNKIKLEIMFEADKHLLNPYSVIAVSPYRFSWVRYQLSMCLIGWLTSPECQKMIGNYRVAGYPLFYAQADETVQREVGQKGL
jgi:tungstate transport system substrate-binding protein